MDKLIETMLSSILILLYSLNVLKIENNTNISPMRTACKEVVHIGDSTSTGLVKSTYIKNADDRINSQYFSIGVEKLYFESDGGRSLLEHRKENENGVMVAKRIRKNGFSGCWVIALGTNDTANVSVGSNVTREKRILKMMEVIGNDPVLWIDTATIKKTGHWSAENMKIWNNSLENTLSNYKNAKIYNWSRDVEDSWFLSDGIHYNSIGTKNRAKLIPQALLKSFPERL